MSQSIKTDRDPHLQRRAFHFLSIFMIFLCTVLLSSKVNWTIYFCLGIPAVLFDLLRQNSKVLNHTALRFLQPIMRRTEVHGLTGASFAIISIGLSYFIYSAPISQLSILYLAVGDPTASLIGLKFGKRKLIGNKSVAGFLGAFFFCSIATFIFFQLRPFPIEPLWAIILAFGFFGALAESLYIPGLDDNLTQPLVSAALMTALIYTMGYGGLLL